MAIPDFLAGAIYGFTGENHMVEMQMCYTGSDDVVNDIRKAISDIEAGSIIKGIEDIGHTINHVPIALKDCENMD